MKHYVYQSAFKFFVSQQAQYSFEVHFTIVISFEYQLDLICMIFLIIETIRKAI